MDRNKFPVKALLPSPTRKSLYILKEKLVKFENNQIKLAKNSNNIGKISRGLNEILD
jgi:hypothetical protein